MGKPLSPSERREYNRVRFDVRSRMGPTNRSGRILLADLVHALQAGGSPRYVRAVLSGEKVSRPALREIRAALRALRQHRARAGPDWL